MSTPRSIRGRGSGRVRGSRGRGEGRQASRGQGSLSTWTESISPDQITPRTPVSGSGSGRNIPSPPPAVPVATPGAGVESVFDRQVDARDSLERDLPDRDEIVESLNDYKIRVANLEAKCASQETQISVLTDALKTKEEVMSKLTTENKALHKVLEERLATVSEAPRSTARFTPARLVENTPPSFLGITFSMDRDIVKWAGAEVLELLPFVEECVRNWAGRSTITVNDPFVINLTSGQQVVPLSPFLIATRPSYFTPSIVAEVDVLTSLAQRLLDMPEWNSIYDSEERRVEVLSFLKTHPVLRSRLKQSISDCASKLKRNARDVLFNLYGYSRLLSRYTAPTGEGKEALEREIATVMSKFLKKNLGSSNWDMGVWRCTSESQLRCEDNMLVHGDVERVPGNNGGEEVEEENETDILFRNKHARDVFAAFVDTQDYDGEKKASRSIMVLARLDAWIATVVDNLQSSVKRGGKRQKMYVEAFGCNLSVSLHQIIGDVRRLVEEWEPQELTIPLSDGDFLSRKQSVVSMAREATTLLQESPTTVMYVAVKSEWFSMYVTDCLGDVHDCYISSISSDFTTITPLGNMNVSQVE